MSEVTVTLNLRVVDREALLSAAYNVLRHGQHYGDAENLDNFSDDELAEIVIADRVGPWFVVGLEVLDD